MLIKDRQVPRIVAMIVSLCEVNRTRTDNIYGVLGESRLGIDPKKIGVKLSQHIENYSMSNALHKFLNDFHYYNVIMGYNWEDSFHTTFNDLSPIDILSVSQTVMEQT